MFVIPLMTIAGLVETVGCSADYKKEAVLNQSDGDWAILAAGWLTDIGTQPRSAKRESLRRLQSRPSTSCDLTFHNHTSNYRAYESCLRSSHSAKSLRKTSNN